MRRGIALRENYDAARLRGLAKATRNAGQSRRLLALGEMYDGGSRTRAARIGSVGLQTLRDWVVRFNSLVARIGWLVAGAGWRRRCAPLLIPEADLAVQAEPRPPPPYPQTAAPGDELGRV